MARVVLGADDDDDVVVATPALTLPHVLKPDQIQPNPENLRPTDLAVDEMAEDLRDGQLHNLNVMTRAEFAKRKPHLADKLGPEPFVAINGNRRLAAARKMGIALKYELHDDWDDQHIDKAMIRENIHRQDINPMLLGRKLRAMLPDYGNSARELARALNVAPAWVNHRIGLTKLHPDLQAAVEAERITWTLARECPRLHPDLQPLLASGDLPAELAQLWLEKLRIKPAEQLARWQAGPPYDPPASEQPVTRPTGPAVNTADSSSVENKSEPPNGKRSSSPTQERPVTEPVRIEFQLPDAKPATLAQALHDRLTVEELIDLVKALRNLVKQHQP